ncbi:SLC26A/SulP transporter family protein [bacterium]|jgi:sulfate permease, SulP family|nr:SLC26A/SulP transporter family protein [bacterium]
MKILSSKSRNFGSEMSMGVLSALSMVLAGVSFSALIFTGPLLPYLPVGLSLILVGWGVATLYSTFRTKVPTQLMGPQDKPIVILASMVISSSLGLYTFQEHALFSTIMTIVVATNLIFGLAMIVVSRYRLSRMAEYIPYPVVGGFLAGTGYYFLDAAIYVLTGMKLSIVTIPNLLSWPTVFLWGPSLVMGLIMFVLIRRLKKSWVMQACVAVLWLGFFLVSFYMGFDMETLREAGFFFQPISNTSFSFWIQSYHFDSIHWLFIRDHLGDIIALLLLSFLGALLNLTGLELGLRQTVDTDHELRVVGEVNLLMTFFGGLLSYTQIGPTLLYSRAGASTRVLGIITAIGCFLCGLFGTGVIAFIPKMVLGALILVFAMEFLYTWIFAIRRHITKIEYGVILMILAAIVVVGFLEGILLGLCVSIVMFVVNYSRINVVRSVLSGVETRSNVVRDVDQKRYLESLGASVNILMLHGYVFFGSATHLMGTIKACFSGKGRQKVKYIILDFRLVHGMDSSSIFVFGKLSHFIHKHNVHLVLTGLSDTIRHALYVHDFFVDERCHYFKNFDLGMEWVETQILFGRKTEKNDRPTAKGYLMEVLHDSEKADALLGYLTPGTFQRGDAIIQEGDQGDQVFFLVQGKVSVYMQGSGDRPIRLRSFSAGTLVGEMSHYLSYERSASVIADTDCKGYVISHDALMRLFQERPKVAAAFHELCARLMAERIYHMNKQLKSLF